MPPVSKQKSIKKEKLHPRNLHRGNYDFGMLCKGNPGLQAFVKLNKYSNLSVDFSDPEAVKALNKALLKHFYGVNYWDIPPGYLCPPIPGRADYIHYMADILANSNDATIPFGNKISVLDIGVGANCVYPLIGHSVYGWQFVGADADPAAVRSAKNIIKLNSHLKNSIEIRLQKNANDIFVGIFKQDEFFDLTICNPPFHASLKEAQAGSAAKWKNLGISKSKDVALNFGGKGPELYYKGGEAAFINRMIEQSVPAAKNCFWFSTLVSKKESMAGINTALKWFGAFDVKVINMAQGQKVSRVVAWTYLNNEEQAAWKNKRWAVD